MPPLLQRAPGPVGADLADPRVTVEVIADFQHLYPAVLAVVAASAGRRLVAVTDAIAATGLPEGRHLLGSSAVVVRDGRVTLADAPETLAGSVLTMDRAVATLVAAGIPLTDAVTAATPTPADALGLPRKGRLASGADAKPRGPRRRGLRARHHGGRPGRPRPAPPVRPVRLDMRLLRAHC